MGKKISNQHLIALKTFPRSPDSKIVDHAFLQERDLLYSVSGSCPYIVDFYFSCTSEYCLFLALEYAGGGDFYSLLQNIGILDEETTAFYLAELTIALESLHSRGTCHRDIKVIKLVPLA